MARAMRFDIDGVAVVLALVVALAVSGTAAAQGDAACTASWFDPVRFDAILRVELSQIAFDAVAGLDFEVTGCGDAVAEVRIVREGAIIDRRTVDLVDVPNAARARLLAFVIAELVRVSPLRERDDVMRDAYSEPVPEATPTPQVVVDVAAPNVEDETPRAVQASDAASTSTLVPRWGHTANGLERWSIGLDHGVRMFVSAPTRQSVLSLRVTFRFVLVELRHFAPQRHGDRDIVRFDGFDCGLGAEYLVRRRNLDARFSVVAHLGLMRMVPSVFEVFTDDETLSYDLTARLAAERRFGRYAIRFGAELAYVHGQRVLQPGDQLLGEAHGFAVTPFLSGAIGSKVSR